MNPIRHPIDAIRTLRRRLKTLWWMCRYVYNRTRREINEKNSWARTRERIRREREVEKRRARIRVVGGGHDR